MAAPLATGKSYKRRNALQPVESAAAAGLRYVSDRAPGIARKPAGKSFRYFTAEGRVVRDPRTLSRIRALVIPPAWRDVWICAREDGHLQATGRDARGRKQYRYHARWREVRDESKYGRVAAFARALPRIRRRVEQHLARPGLPREKVIATVVRLLETTFIRVGNPEYARENESFGLTTLREKQVRVRGEKLCFQFRGKSGVEHRIELADRRLASIVRRMQDLPGEELFRYVGEDGEVRSVESADVNAYLKEAAGQEFTSKDFRTWAGTLLAARALRAAGPARSQSHGKKIVVEAIEGVAARLGNTRSVCRKCYIHPRVIERYLDGSLHATLARGATEAGIVALIERPKARRAGAAHRRRSPGTRIAPLPRRLPSATLGAVT